MNFINSLIKSLSECLSIENFKTQNINNNLSYKSECRLDHINLELSSTFKIFLSDFDISFVYQFNLLTQIDIVDKGESKGEHKYSHFN